MWLVQRGTVRGDWQEGQKVTDFFCPDYMGSAEFEFGALPKSLRAMFEKDMKQMQFNIGKNTIWIYCDEDSFEQAKEDITKLSTGDMRLKEWVGFKDWVYPEQRSSYRKEDPEDNIWWEVEKHYVFSLREHAIRDFPKALAASKEYMDKKKKVKS